MIIKGDILKPYWTEEETIKREEIYKKRKHLSKILAYEDPEKVAEREVNEAGKLVTPNLYQYQKSKKELDELLDKVESRYINSRSKQEILKDAEEIIKALEKKDYLDFISYLIKAIYADNENENNFFLEEMGDFISERSYEHCCHFIRTCVGVQIRALEGDEASIEKINELIKKRVSHWYKEPYPAFLPLAHGKPTDAFGFMSTKRAKKDKITGSATLDKMEVQLVIEKLNELQATLGISTDKLLSTAIANFTKQNDFRNAKKQQPKREVEIPLKEYALLLGYAVEERETSTPEEAEQEKKRAKNQLDNARKAIRKDLNIIHASTLKWEESIKGKPRDFARVSLVTFTGIRNGMIKISFSPEIANYLAERNLITQYPTKLLKISGRQPTAYYIGKKLAMHYSNENNQICGSYNRLGIPTLLKVTDLPTYEEIVKKNNRNWERLLKEPLENALDVLTQEGVIEDWKYTHAKGVDLTDEEAYNITYKDWSKLYVQFSLKDAPDHKARIQAKQEKKKANKGKKKKAYKEKKS